MNNSLSVIADCSIGIEQDSIMVYYEKFQVIMFNQTGREMLTGFSLYMKTEKVLSYLNLTP